MGGSNLTAYSELDSYPELFHISVYIRLQNKKSDGH